MSRGVVSSGNEAFVVGEARPLTLDAKGRLRATVSADPTAIPAAFATGQQAIGTSAALIIGADSTRTFLDIANTSATEAVFIGAAGVTATTGHRIAPGGSFTLDARMSAAAIYGVVAANTATVTFARF